jgi:hypothetical protein
VKPKKCRRKRKRKEKAREDKREEGGAGRERSNSPNTAILLKIQVEFCLST